MEIIGSRCIEMNWQAVVRKLKSAADQHNHDAEVAESTGRTKTAQHHRVIADTCYALMAALEAGINSETSP